MTNDSRCGYVAIIGKPNVGKSTLLNAILQKKVSITTPKPQTTRSQILGIKTLGEDQAVFIDTPGIHEAENRAMNRYMNRMASSVIGDADVVLFVVDAGHWNKDDELVLHKLQHVSNPVILVVNKLDTLTNKAEVLPYIEKLQSKFTFAEIIPLSARNAENVAELEKVITNFLPKGPHLFPDDQVTDKPLRFQIAELIREKIIDATEQEIPYSTTVSIEDIKQEAKHKDIHAIIWVEREGQKPILIGKNGERLKKIGTLARKDIEKLINEKVFLRLWVKVKDKWTDDERALKSLGYE